MSKPPPHPIFEQGKDGDSSVVVLPCEPDQFKDFISGLLGKPQTLNRRIFGPFEVTKNDIENLYHLVEQRIISQNEATLIQFTARIIYSDNSSVLINSFEDFKSYNEIRPLISVGIYIGWTFLIRFQNRKFPEKQQIDVNFQADPSYDLRSRTHDIEIRYPPDIEKGHITIAIAHTDRSWGTDIDALLGGNLSMLVKTETGTRAIVNEFSGTIGFLSGLCVFSSLVFIGFSYLARVADRVSESVKAVTLSDPDWLIKKIDRLGDLIIFGAVKNQAFYSTAVLIGSFVAALLVGNLIGSSATHARPSFVLLTKKSIEQRNRKLGELENRWWKFVVYIAGTILLSVAGNYVFRALEQHWGL